MRYGGDRGGVHSYLTPFLFGPPPQDRPGSRSRASPTNAARIPDCSRRRRPYEISLAQLVAAVGSAFMRILEEVRQLQEGGR